MKSARSLGLMLCVFAWVTLACSAPTIPLFARSEPTATPRPTRTSRPTFTPTPTDTPTPPFTPTPTNTNTPTATDTPLPTDTPVPPTATNTRRPVPPTATFTPAPPPPPTNTPAPSFTFSAGSPIGLPNCVSMGIFGIVNSADGGRLAGVTVQVFVAGGSKVPGGEVTTSNRSDDRNFEINLYKEGKYQVVLSDGTREISPRVSVTINYIDQCDVKEGQAGSQWVKVDFSHN